MHVIMLGGDLTASVGGGIGTVARTIMGAEAMHGVDIRYHTTVAAEGSRTHKARTMVAGQLRFVQRLREKPDLVHIHIADGPSFWRKSTYAREARLAGIPVCLHGHFTSLIDLYRSNRLKARAIGRVFADAECVFALSKDMERQLVEMSGGRAQVRVLHNPCPPDGFDPSPRPSTDTPHVLFMGRVGDRKGIFDLVAAWPSVLQAVPGARLIVAGDGELDKLKVMVTELRLGPNIDILGWISGDERMEAYRRANVFSLPSYAEGLPMGVLEAMGAGLPVVSTAINGTPDAVKHGVTGFLHAPGDHQAIAEHLVTLLSDPALRDQMGQAAYGRVIQEFDPETQAARLRRHWEDTIAAHKMDQASAR
jgi:glycosyltransferase involved in cell wall biosynthesis